MDDETSLLLREINAKLDRLLAIHAASAPVDREVLNLAEAIRFVGKAELTEPEKAFARWRKRHQLRPCGKGRYSLRSLKAAMEREARKTYEHAR